MNLAISNAKEPLHWGLALQRVRLWDKGIDKLLFVDLGLKELEFATHSLPNEKS
ncbi:MAG: hypothetical protein ACXWDN_15440 [Limisphaerales bacterium]